MTEPELFTEVQSILIQALSCKDHISHYIAHPGDQEEYNMLICLITIVGSSHKIIEAIHRKRFTTSITERIEAVERNGHR